MKKAACAVLILTIFLIAPLSSEARGGFRGWWAPWAIIGGAAILAAPYYGHYYYPPPYYPYYASPPVMVVPPEYVQPVPAPPSLPSSPSSMERHFIYPRLGQNQKQQADDQYQCHLWAVAQTGYDPTNMSSGLLETQQPPNLSNDYWRAMDACLDARGYTMK